MERNKCVAVVLGVEVQEEHSRPLWGALGQGLLDRYADHLYRDNSSLTGPIGSNRAEPDVIGFSIVSGGETMLERYKAAGYTNGELGARPIAFNDMKGVHLEAALADATANWEAFAAFCKKAELEFPAPRLFLIVDEEDL